MLLPQELLKHPPIAIAVTSLLADQLLLSLLRIVGTLLVVSVIYLEARHARKAVCPSLNNC